jgi:hypothetical protein
MPYQGEYASKVSHFDIVRNPEVAQFLESCEYLTPPSDEEGEAMAARFEEPPPTDGVVLPEHVVAVDGSPHESSIDDRLPSTKIGYVKVGCVLIDMARFHSLRVWDGRFVDPFRVASLQNSHNALTFSLPSANIRRRGKGSVRDSFRAAVDEQLYGERTRFNANDPATSLRTTLFHLASRRLGELGTGDPRRLKLHRCPDCGAEKIEVHDLPGAQHCPHCGGEVYPSDCLRLWEEVADYQSNQEAITRFMLIVEHMLPIHYIRYLAGNSLAALGTVAFFMDGPLAVFGNAAWLHLSIMGYLNEVNRRLEQVGQPRLLFIGLQKTGQVAEHLGLIERFIPANRLFAIDDDYRYRYILTGRDPAGNGFGHETYYGQDFIFKTPTGRVFVLALPYPFASKNQPGVDFIQAKTEMTRYAELARALALIAHFESDLYANAVIPIALAHRYTAISLVPGGRVLDLLTRQSLPPVP